ncbi:MAG: ADP-ribosylglycohydrolase family protein, partial [Succinivibrionaceae bacterium]|nr:ADP-ribosylglycohydrolase family protein [Succinivibrionaceae bacterium]
RALARAVTMASHDHPEAIRGAEAVTVAVRLALEGEGKAAIRRAVEAEFYPLGFTIAQRRPAYRFDATCPGSVPEAIVCFLEGEGFEGTLRLAVSLGGDSDTIASIAGAIAGAHWGVPPAIAQECERRLDGPLLDLLRGLEGRLGGTPG